MKYLSDSYVSWRCVIRIFLTIGRPFGVDNGLKTLIIKRLWLCLLGKSYQGFCANIRSAGVNRCTNRVPPDIHAVNARVQGNIRRGDDDDRGNVVPTCSYGDYVSKSDFSIVEKIDDKK